MLDLGCGYGWHCKYAVEQGAEKVLGIDVSRRMIREAEKRNPDERITYEVLSLEEYDYPEEAWDCVVSNLALHYIPDISAVSGRPVYWPVDDYFYPGERKTHFLGCEVIKYHHTLTQIINGLLKCGFVIDMLEEARPSGEMMDVPGMKDEMRRPMMLMIRAGKQ